MNKQELTNAMTVAKSDSDLSSEMGQIDIFDGFALPDFKPVACTTRQVAALIKWQCFQFDGGIDAEALNEIRVCGRKKFEVVG